MSVAFMYPVVILENKVLRATAKTHKIVVFKNHHTELGESITLSELWVPIDANHSELQWIKWDAKTIQEAKSYKSRSYDWSYVSLIVWNL